MRESEEREKEGKTKSLKKEWTLNHLQWNNERESTKKGKMIKKGKVKKKGKDRMWARFVFGWDYTKLYSAKLHWYIQRLPFIKFSQSVHISREIRVACHQFTLGLFAAIW